MENITQTKINGSSPKIGFTPAPPSPPGFNVGCRDGMRRVVGCWVDPPPGLGKNNANDVDNSGVGHEATTLKCGGEGVVAADSN